MVEIDGSTGEGGGQILRTALALACVKQAPVRIFNIRKNRTPPGLKPQHLQAVRAAADISRAKVSGDDAGSKELFFYPGPIRSSSEKSQRSDYKFDIGTAGSTTLLFQTILPALTFAEAPSSVTITGGTHNPLAPPFEYIKDAFLPTLGRLGVAVAAKIERYGFYPKGGGILHFLIDPRQPKGAQMRERGAFVSLTGISAVANLPASIAERQRAAAVSRLNGFAPEIEIREVPAIGAGTFVFILARYEGALCGFSSLGKIGKRAEVVGEEAAQEFLAHHLCANAQNAALDPHMADQIALYLALSGENSSFTTSKITEHLLTNLWVITRFLKFEYKVTGEKGKPGLVEMRF